MTNPFLLYVVTFLLTVVIYQLGWSNLYPALSATMILFLSFTLIIGLVFAIVHKYKLKPPMRSAHVGPDAMAPLVTAIILALSLLQFAYDRDLPLLQVVSGSAPTHKAFVDDYGIPLLHPILLSFSSFFSVYLFHLFLSTQHRRNLFYLILTVLPLILFFSRGSLALTLIACVFVYVFFSRRYTALRAVVLLAISVLLAYIFGLSGSIRVADPAYILQIGGATTNFLTAPVPRDFFWSYLYITSPLANFQLHVDSTPPHTIEHDFAAFLVFDVLPDFISRHVADLYHIEAPSSTLVSPALTARSAYARSYLLLGWYGPTLLFGYFLLLTIFLLYALNKRSRFFLTGLAFLNTLTVLLVFSNTLVFSGTVLPILYSMILGTFYKGVVWSRHTTTNHMEVP